MLLVHYAGHSCGDFCHWLLRVVPIPVVGMNSENPAVKTPLMDLGMSPVIFYLHSSLQTEEEKKEGC